MSDLTKDDIIWYLLEAVGWLDLENINSDVLERNFNECLYILSDKKYGYDVHNTGSSPGWPQPLNLEEEAEEFDRLRDLEASKRIAKRLEQERTKRSNKKDPE